MNYNTLENKWNVHELQSILIKLLVLKKKKKKNDDEAWLKEPVIHNANLVGPKAAKKKLRKKNGRHDNGYFCLFFFISFMINPCI